MADTYTQIYIQPFSPWQVPEDAAFEGGWRFVRMVFPQRFRAYGAAPALKKNNLPTAA
jgi:hypothetical protein